MVILQNDKVFEFSSKSHHKYNSSLAQETLYCAIAILTIDVRFQRRASWLPLQCKVKISYNLEDASLETVKQIIDLLMINIFDIKWC